MLLQYTFAGINIWERQLQLPGMDAIIVTTWFPYSGSTTNRF